MTNKDSAVAESIALLFAKDFRNACLVVSHYEAEQASARGVGIGWSKYDPANDVYLLETLFASHPKILIGLSDEEWTPLYVASAAMHLWGTNSAKKWLPSDFKGLPRFDNDTAMRMVLFNAQHKREMARFRANGIEKAIVHGCASSCDACQNINGKSMLLDQIPELPHSACTHKMGCRCYVEGEYGA